MLRRPMPSKHKNLGSVYHVARHHTRESVCKTADPARLHLNKSNGPATARGGRGRHQARIDDAQTRAKGSSGRTR